MEPNYFCITGPAPTPPELKESEVPSSSSGTSNQFTLTNQTVLVHMYHSIPANAPDVQTSVRYYVFKILGGSNPDVT